MMHNNGVKFMQLPPTGG